MRVGKEANLAENERKSDEALLNRDLREGEEKSGVATDSHFDERADETLNAEGNLNESEGICIKDYALDTVIEDDVNDAEDDVVKSELAPANPASSPPDTFSAPPDTISGSPVLNFAPTDANIQPANDAEDIKKTVFEEELSSKSAEIESSWPSAPHGLDCGPIIELDP